MKIKEHDRREALVLLETELNVFRDKSWSDLYSLIEAEPFRKEVKIDSNKWYQIEIIVDLDEKENGNIRVNGSIDDGGFRNYLPQSSGFLVAKKTS